MPTRFLVFILLLGACENIQHATNNNLLDVRQYSVIPERVEMIEKRVAVRKSSEVSGCKKIGDFKAKDNPIDQGEKYAVLYLMDKVNEAGGNTLVVTEQKKVGDYGHTAYGIGYKCTK